MTKTATPISARRFLDLDLLKLVAIGLMIYDHVIKFLLDHTSFELSYELYFLFLFTPFSSALFLFISGILLQHRLSLGINKDKYFIKRLTVGLILIILSYGLWVLSINQGHWASTGILQTLGFLWIGGVLFNRLTQGKLRLLWLGLIILSVLGLNQFLLGQNILIPFINSFSFSLLPHGVYFLWGMWLVLLKQAYSRLARGWVLCILGISGVVATHLLSGKNLLLALHELPVRFGYWSPSLTMVSYTLWIFLVIFVFVLKFPYPQKPGLGSLLLAKIAKHALLIYISHLVGLKVLEKFIYFYFYLKH